MRLSPWSKRFTRWSFALCEVIVPDVRTKKTWRRKSFSSCFRGWTSPEARTGIPLEHWVSRLAVRTCLDALRAKGRRPELRMGDLSEDQRAWLEFMIAAESAPPDSAAVSARELVENLLSQLPPEDRLVISLLDLEEKSVKEIGKITGWSVSLVKVRAFRARRKLRQLAEALKRANHYDEF